MTRADAREAGDHLGFDDEGPAELPGETPFDAMAATNLILEAEDLRAAGRLTLAEAHRLRDAMQTLRGNSARWTGFVQQLELALTK